MVSIVIYCEFEKVGNACRNSLNYKVKKEVCGPDRALFEKGFDVFPSLPPSQCSVRIEPCLKRDLMID